MSLNRRVAIIGCGHMGTAIAQGLQKSPGGPALHIVEASDARRDALKGLGLDSTSDLSLRADDVVVLAVPPQVFAEFALATKGRLPENLLVISVMAGLSAASIARALGTSQVVRSIPNTPSEVFEGMTVYFASPAVTPENVDVSERLLRCIGRVLRVADEGLVDDATALCGGGPAFVSYIAEAICRFATSRGFSAQDATLMTSQVFRGTAELLETSGKKPMQLCREVMTPNGTTERGIACFEASKLLDIIERGLGASAARSRELAQCAQ